MLEQLLQDVRDRDGEHGDDDADERGNGGDQIESTVLARPLLG